MIHSLKEKIANRKSQIAKGDSRVLEARTMRLDQPPILPVELLIEVLVRLPVKSLLRYKAVSKSWRYLICSSSFIDEHFDKADEPNRRRLAILLEYATSLPPGNCTGVSLKTVNYNVVPFPIEKTITHPITPMGLLLLSYCRGVLMIGTHREGPDWFLWNPSTKEHKDIRPSPNLTNPQKVASGLGYDFCTKSHKVVVVGDMFPRPSVPQIIEVYDFKTSSWTCINDGGGIQYTPCFWGIETVTLFNGFPCWIHTQAHVDLCFLEHRIVYYDFGANKLMEVTQPKCWKNNIFLLNTEGCLSICRKNPELREYEIWVMKEFGKEESWTKLGTIPSSHPFPVAIIFAEQGEVLVGKDGSKFVIRKLTEENPQIEIRGSCSTRLQGISYVESLVSLNK